MTADLVDFLRARLDDDERTARAATVPAHDGYKPHPELSEWTYDGDEIEYVSTPEMKAHKYHEPFLVTCDSEGITPSVESNVAEHIARHSPARVLREVAAKRAIIDHAANITHWIPRGDTYAKPLLHTLAAVYADHPAYRTEWTPA